MLYVLAIPAPQRILGGVSQLANGRVKSLAKPDIELNRSKSVCIGIHELPPWWSKFSSASPPAQFRVETNRQGKIACDGKPIPEALLDDMVLTEVEAHLLGSGRLANVLGRLKSEMSKEKEQSNLRLATLRQETAKARLVFNNLLNVASLTDDLQSDPALIERIAEAQGNAMRLERALESQVSLIDVSADPTPDQIDQFSTVMAERLRAHDRRLAKGFLNIMLSEVLVAADQITITGSLTDLKRHIAKVETDVTENQAMPAVHRYGRRWCPRQGSNPRPPDYKSGALPTELQGHSPDGELPDFLFL